MGNKTENKTGKRIAIVGGGQLAKMTALSALQLGCDVLGHELYGKCGPFVRIRPGGKMQLHHFYL